MLPYCFGGNKVRIAFQFYEDMRRKGFDTMIGYGNSRSNLCRVMANIGKKDFYMIQPEDIQGGFSESNNSRLVRLFGATIIPCSRQNIAQTIQNTMNLLYQSGKKPYYMNGDCFGNGNETVPVRAYVDVMKEISLQEEQMGTSFDYIAIAAGTCMSLSGLICGNILYPSKKHPRKVLGFAVAHDTKRGLKNISKYAGSYTLENNICRSMDGLYEYDDYCLCGGYAQSNSSIKELIESVMLEYGLSLDETYTGKALYGLIEYAKRNHIEGKNILFIHTGGTPLFFDWLQNIS